MIKNVSIENSEAIRFDISLPAINNIELTGVGDFVLSGESKGELTITITGVGNVTAYDMKVDTCNITFTGVGGCKSNISANQLNVIISGVGNVYYKGDPTINITTTGLGQLINAN